MCEIFKLLGTKSDEADYYRHLGNDEERLKSELRMTRDFEE
jgi:hypothetical protein